MARPHPLLIELAAGRKPPASVADPTALLESSLDHRMHGLLWTAVQKEDVVVPISVERTLAALDLRTEALHERLRSTMRDVVSKLGDRGFEVATFKGVAAESRWYDRTGERPTRDVDLWLAPHDVKHLEDVLALLQPGHRLRSSVSHLVASGALQSIDIQYDGVWVDLHVDPFKLGVPTKDLTAIWARRVHFDDDVTMLDPVASLTQFLLHLNKDRFSWLLGFADVHRLIEMEPGVIDDLERLAESEGWATPVFCSLSRVQDVLGLRRERQAGGTRWLSERLWSWMWPEQSMLRGEVGILMNHRRQNLLPLLLRDGFLEGIEMNVRTALPPHQLLDAYYPEIEGRYLTRLVRGRLARWRERRDVIRDSLAKDELQAEPPQARRREPGRGSFVVVGGPDGSGKTTLARELIDQYEGPGQYFHFIPEPLGRLEDSPPRTPGVEKPRPNYGSRPLGLLRIGRNLLRSWIAYLLSIRPAVRSGSLVVGDRWLYGYLAQPWALKFYGPAWVARLVLRLMPQPDVVVVLDAPAEVMYARKPELAVSEIEAERERWANLAGPVLMLDATRSPRELARDVVDRMQQDSDLRRYPPLLGHVLIPASPRSAALVGTSLYAATRPRGLAAHRVGRLMVRAMGTWWLPRARPGQVSVSPEVQDVAMRLFEKNGISHDRLALYTRTQAQRSGYSFLAIQGDQAAAFVRVGTAANIESEAVALEMLEYFRPKTFDYPKLIDVSYLDGTGVVVQTPVLRGLHRPPERPPLDTIVSEIQEALQELDRPENTPEHWAPMHGDLTPWNLRQSPQGLVLVDWESVGWGPPNADECLYFLTSVSVGLSATEYVGLDESTGFWLDRFPDMTSRRDFRLMQNLVRTASLHQERAEAADSTDSLSDRPNPPGSEGQES